MILPSLVARRHRSTMTAVTVTLQLIILPFTNSATTKMLKYKNGFQKAHKWRLKCNAKVKQGKWLLLLPVLSLVYFSLSCYLFALIFECSAEVESFSFYRPSPGSESLLWKSCAIWDCLQFSGNLQWGALWSIWLLDLSRALMGQHLSQCSVMTWKNTSKCVVIMLCQECLRDIRS